MASKGKKEGSAKPDSGFAIRIDGSAGTKSSTKKGKSKKRHRLAEFRAPDLNIDSSDEDSDTLYDLSPVPRGKRRLDLTTADSGPIGSKSRSARSKKGDRSGLAVMSRSEMERRSSILGVDLGSIGGGLGSPRARGERRGPKKKRHGARKGRRMRVAQDIGGDLDFSGKGRKNGGGGGGGLMAPKHKHVRRVSSTLSDEDTESSSDSEQDYDDVVIHGELPGLPEGKPSKKTSSGGDGYGSGPDSMSQKGGKKRRRRKIKKFKILKSKGKEEFDRRRRRRSIIAMKKAQFKLESRNLKGKSTLFSPPPSLDEEGIAEDSLSPLTPIQSDNDNKKTKKGALSMKPIRGGKHAKSDLGAIREGGYQSRKESAAEKKRRKEEEQRAKKKREEAEKYRVKVKSIYEINLSLEKSKVRSGQQGSGGAMGWKSPPPMATASKGRAPKVTNPQCFNLDNECILLFGYDGCGKIYMFDLILNHWTIIGSYPKSFRPMKHCVCVFPERDYRSVAAAAASVGLSSAMDGKSSASLDSTQRQIIDSELPVLKYHIVSFGGNNRHLMTCHLTRTGSNQWSLSNWTDLSRNEELCLNFGRGCRAVSMICRWNDAGSTLTRRASAAGQHRFTDSVLLKGGVAGSSMSSLIKPVSSSAGAGSSLSSSDLKKKSMSTVIERPDFLMVVSGGYPNKHMLACYRISLNRSNTGLSLLFKDSKFLPTTVDWYWHGMCTVSNDTCVLFKDKVMYYLTVQGVYDLDERSAAATAAAASAAGMDGLAETMLGDSSIHGGGDMSGIAADYSSEATVVEGPKHVLIDVQVKADDMTKDSPWKEDPAHAVDPYRDRPELRDVGLSKVSQTLSPSLLSNLAGDLKLAKIPDSTTSPTVTPSPAEDGDTKGVTAVPSFGDSTSSTGSSGSKRSSGKRGSGKGHKKGGSGGAGGSGSGSGLLSFDEILETPSLYSSGFYSLFGDFGLPLMVVAGGFNEKKGEYSDSMCFFDFKSKKAMTDLGLYTGDNRKSLEGEEALDSKKRKKKGPPPRQRRLRIRPHGMGQMGVVLVRNAQSKIENHSYYLHVIGGHGAPSRTGSSSSLSLVTPMKTGDTGNFHVIYEISLKNIVFASIQSKFAIDESEIKQLRQQNELMSSLLTMHATGQAVPPGMSAILGGSGVAASAGSVPSMGMAGITSDMVSAKTRSEKSSALRTVSRPLILLLGVGDYCFDRSETNMFEGSGKGKFEMQMDGHIVNDMRHWRSLFEKLMSGERMDEDDFDGAGFRDDGGHQSEGEGDSDDEKSPSKSRKKGKKSKKTLKKKPKKGKGPRSTSAKKKKLKKSSVEPMFIGNVTGSRSDDNASMTRDELLNKLAEFREELMKNVDETSSEDMYDSCIVIVRGLMSCDGQSFVTSDGLLIDFDWMLHYLFRQSTSNESGSSMSQTTLRRIKSRKLGPSAVRRSVKQQRLKAAASAAGGSGAGGRSKSDLSRVGGRYNASGSQFESEEQSARKAAAKKRALMKLSNIPKVFINECVSLQNGHLHHFVTDDEFLGVDSESGKSVTPIVRLSDRSVMFDRVVSIPRELDIDKLRANYGRKVTRLLMKHSTWQSAMSNVLWVECRLPLFEVYSSTRMGVSFMCDSLMKIYKYFPFEHFHDWLFKCKERVARKSDARCLVDIRKDTMLFPFRFVPNRR